MVKLRDAIRNMETQRIGEVSRRGPGFAPGSPFGPGNGGYPRLCFALCEARLAEAMERLATALAA